MTTTLDDVTARKKRPEPSAEQRAAEELVRRAKEQGLSLTGPDGLLRQLTKTVLETALNQEMTEHLGHEKNGRADPGNGNVRNGTRAKTVLTESTGQVQIEVPRDRAGTSGAADREETPAAAGRGRRDRPVAVCQGPDHRGDLGALRADLRRRGEQGDDLEDHRQGDRRYAGLAGSSPRRRADSTGRCEYRDSPADERPVALPRRQQSETGLGGLSEAVGGEAGQVTGPGIQRGDVRDVAVSARRLPRRP